MAEEGGEGSRRGELEALDFCRMREIDRKWWGWKIDDW